MQDVAGKIAFITGAASGMGLGMARAFGDANHNGASAEPETISAAPARIAARRRRSVRSNSKIKVDPMKYWSWK